MPSFLPLALGQSSNSEFVSLREIPSSQIGIFLVILAFLSLAWFFRRRAKRSKTKIATHHPQEQDSSIGLQSPTSIPKSQLLTDSIPKKPDEVLDILSVSSAHWIEKLKHGLTKSRAHLSDSISTLLGKKATFDDQLLEEIHEILFRTDMGAEMADHLVEQLRRAFYGKPSPTWAEVNSVFNATVQEVLKSNELNKDLDSQDSPKIILVVGVNGVGKTTSIGKLAAHYIAEGKSVLLAAGDTFRAAAIEQLQVWGERLNVPVVAQQQGSDPASVAFDAVRSAKSKGIDVLIIDTAGRLHNKQDLMEELSKIKRVIGKEQPGAPHDTLLVIDATTGQNAFQQVQAFKQIVQITGLIVTKLDGTAKGGCVIGIKKKFQIPIKYIGVGEKASDLRFFEPSEFAQSLFPI